MTQPASFQERVRHWIVACFGLSISDDKIERGDRLLEEVLELLQSGDYPAERAAAMIPYVYGRAKGEPVQELGGVMVCLAAYCHPHNLDMDQAGETELSRIWTKIDKIRSKHASKPTGDALLLERTPSGYRWKYEGENAWTYQATAPKSYPDVIIEPLYT